MIAGVRTEVDARLERKGEGRRCALPAHKGTSLGSDPL